MRNQPEMKMIFFHAETCRYSNDVDLAFSPLRSVLGRKEERGGGGNSSKFLGMMKLENTPINLSYSRIYRSEGGGTGCLKGNTSSVKVPFFEKYLYLLPSSKSENNRKRMAFRGTFLEMNSSFFGNVGVVFQ